MWIVSGPETLVVDAIRLDVQRRPMIYAYTYGENAARQWTHRTGGQGILKVGYTTRDVRERVAEQLKTVVIDRPKILFEEAAITEDGVAFSDRDVHARLSANGASRLRIGGKEDGTRSEWFEATLEEVKVAYEEVRRGVKVNVPNNFAMRVEQKRAVETTAAYFEEQCGDADACHFLWNAKMRFGKSFAAYQLALRMGWRRILILTYKPAAEDAWRGDLLTHQDFQPVERPLDRWYFVGKGEKFEDVVEDERKPVAWMASFQDLEQYTQLGKVKDRHELLYSENWDCVVLDEYHFGAWKDGAKAIYAADPDGDETDDLDEYDAKNIAKHLKVQANHWLYLSGTPFRALAEGEFEEERIFNWSYADEQKAKLEWKPFVNGEFNPYAELPRMVLLTYRIGDLAAERATETFDNEFGLNVFFAAKTSRIVSGTGNGSVAASIFEREAHVQRWLDWLHDSGMRSGFDRAVAPFANPQIRSSLDHTVWHLRDIAACEAMRDLLRRPENSFFKEFKVICAAGSNVGTGVKALEPVRGAIRSGTNTKTITLTCGKLLTGVTVPQWGAIFMLRDTQSPETYFQAAFRVQSPWSVRDVENPNQKIVIKRDAYVFDFSPNRSLDMIYEYCEKQAQSIGNDSTTNDVKGEVRKFLNFLPVLAFDDGSLSPLDEIELMDIATAGTGTAMLARRWRSKSMVNLTPVALSRILMDGHLVHALENMEAFRNLRDHSSKIIAADGRIKKAKSGRRPKGSGRQKLTQEEKDAKKVRDNIQESLSQLLCKVPIFMYLTDYREETLYDVIHQIEPELFVKVTGLEIRHFDALCEAGVFPKALLNQAIGSFKRQESYGLMINNAENAISDEPPERESVALVR